MRGWCQGKKETPYRSIDLADLRQGVIPGLIMVQTILDVQEKALKELHNYGHTSATFSDVQKIFENYAKYGPGPKFPHRVDKNTSDNPSVTAYLMNGSNDDGSVLLCLKDFAGNVVSRNIGKLEGRHYNGAPV